VAGALIGARWGATGVATGVAVASLLTSAPGVYYLLSTTTLEAGGVLATWLVPCVASAAGVIALHLLTDALPSAEGVGGLLVRGVVYLAVYALMWLVLPGGRGMLRKTVRHT
jgi:hypothetical protein